MTWTLWRRLRAVERVTVAVIVLYTLTFTVLLPATCRRLVYSPYFVGRRNDPDIVDQVVKTNDERYRKSKDYLRSLPERDFGRRVDEVEFNVDEEYDLVVGVITVNRDREPTTPNLQAHGVGYLTQTVARLIWLLAADSSPGFERKQLFVCNVDAHPETYREALEIDRVARTVSRRPNTTRRDDNSTVDIFDREKDDYAFCLDAAAKFRSRFILLIEDDVLLEENALATISYLMWRSQLIARNDWLLIKLYYPIKWQGYAFEMDYRIIELLGIGIVCGSLVALSASFCMSKWRKSRPTRWWFVVAALYAVAVSAGVGRPYVTSWRRSFVWSHRLVMGPRACTQAVLYPSNVVASLASYLRHLNSTAEYSVDLAVGDFSQAERPNRYLVEPNVAQHIGMVSTVRSAAKWAEHFL